MSPAPHINSKASSLIRSFEQCRLSAYLDAKGVPTIGWGHTGPAVRMGMRITQAAANALFDRDVERFEACVSSWVGEATPNQYGAMVSLAYNIGCEAFRTSSVLRFHNQGRFKLAAAAFLLFVKSGRKGHRHTLLGLVRRRNAERKLYESVE